LELLWNQLEFIYGWHLVKNLTIVTKMVKH